MICQPDLNVFFENFHILFIINDQYVSSLPFKNFIISRIF